MSSLFSLSFAPNPSSLMISQCYFAPKEAKFPNPSSFKLSPLSFTPKNHFPICCSMPHGERMFIRKKDELESFYKKENLDSVSSEAKKTLVTKWIHDNMVLEFDEKYKKVKNKVMKKPDPETFEEIEFGDVLDKGKNDLFTFMLCAIKVLTVEEEKTESNTEEDKKLKKKKKDQEMLKKKLEEEEEKEKMKEQREEEGDRT